MKNPFEWIPDDKKAGEMAAKRTARLKEQAGLFAECIEAVTAEQIIRAAEVHRDKFQATLDRLQADGDDARTQLAQLVSPGVLAALDARRACLPGGSEFHADFWKRELAKLK